MKSLAIEREYGTGGWKLGKRIPEIKGIPFYDVSKITKEIIVNAFYEEMEN